MGALFTKPGCAPGNKQNVAPGKNAQGSADMVGCFKGHTHNLQEYQPQKNYYSMPF